MDPKKFFAQLTRRNGYKIAKSCFPLGWWSRSPGSHDAVINVYDVVGKLIGLRRHKAISKTNKDRLLSKISGYVVVWNTHRNRAADRFVIAGAVCTMMEAPTKRCRSLLTY
jgi:hypothetical protein